MLVLAGSAPVVEHGHDHDKPGHDDDHHHDDDEDDHHGHKDDQR